MALDEKVKKCPMEYLGYINDFYRNPPQKYKESEGKGYKYYFEKSGRCETTIYCPEGGFYYKEDSSD